VALRALALLAAFDAEHRELGLAELSRRSGTPRSTTLRLARNLVEWGALERTREGGYVVGLRLFEIASLAPRSHGLREVAMPFLGDLHEVTGEHVLLAVPEGDQALLLERLSATDAAPVEYRVGGRMPLHDTGVGLVLLAEAEPRLRAAVLAGLDADRARRLRRAISDTRRRGVAVFRRTRVADAAGSAQVTSVAAGIRDPSGRTVAAVSVVLPAHHRPPQIYEHVVRATALTVSRALARTSGRRPWG